MSQIREQVGAFHEAAARNARGHYKAAEAVEAWHRRFGVPAASLSAIVATSIFATLAADPAMGWKIATGLLAVASAVLTSLQTFFGYQERAREHRGAAAAYAALRREIELVALRREFQVVDTAVESVALAELERLRGRLDELGSSSPLIPPRAYDSAIAELAAEADPRDAINAPAQ